FGSLRYSWSGSNTWPPRYRWDEQLSLCCVRWVEQRETHQLWPEWWVSLRSTHPTNYRRSIRPWHAEDVLADIGEDEVGRDRGGWVRPGSAPLASVFVLLRERKAAIGGEGGLGGVPGCF